jgi:hydrogenase maturation protease
VKPVLVIGLGNPLMGDDGVGARAAELMAADSAVTARADVVAGGTDLLRCMDEMEGRRRVILIDAAQGFAKPGEVVVVDDPGQVSGLEYAHTLSAVRALELMRGVMPSLGGTRFTWVLAGIASAGAGETLSPEGKLACESAAGEARRLVRMK